MRFEQFASQLEAQTGFHFYFDPKAVDSLFVTVQVQAQPVRAVLAQALQGTTFHFAIDDENRVFVTQGGHQSGVARANFTRPVRPMRPWPRPTRMPPPNPSAARAYVSASEYKVYEIGAPGSGAAARPRWPATSATLKTGEPVIGASIYSESPNIGASTDQFGAYSRSRCPRAATT